MMPVILAVHFPAKKLAKLRMAAMRLGAKVRVVEKWEYRNAVGALTGDLDSFESFYETARYICCFPVLSSYPENTLRY